MKSHKDAESPERDEKAVSAVNEIASGVFPLDGGHRHAAEVIQGTSSLPEGSLDSLASINSDVVPMAADLGAIAAGKDDLTATASVIENLCDDRLSEVAQGAGFGMLSDLDTLVAEESSVASAMAGVGANTEIRDDLTAAAIAMGGLGGNELNAAIEGTEQSVNGRGPGKGNQKPVKEQKQGGNKAPGEHRSTGGSRAALEQVTVDAQQLAETGIMGKRQALAYSFREIHGLGRQETAMLMDTSGSNVDNLYRAAKEHISEAREAISIVDGGRNKGGENR